MEEFKKKAIELISTYGGKILLAIATLVVGLIVIKLLNKLIEKALKKSKLDGTVKSVIRNISKAFLYIVLVIGIIEILGVSMSSVVAVIASCGLAVGFALQGALGNLAGGLMILIFKPFKVGDFIESTGAEGTVKDISIFYTTVMTIDNKQIFVPNGDLMNANVTNFSVADKRRVDQDYKITNDIDAELVKSVLLGAAENTEGVLSEPKPFARMTAVDDDTYIFTVRAWDDPEERIAVRIVKDEEEKEEKEEKEN